MGSFKEDYKICHKLGERIDPEQMEIVHQKNETSWSIVVSPSGKYVANAPIRDGDDDQQHGLYVTSTEKYSANSVKLLEPFDKGLPNLSHEIMFNRTEEYLAVFVSDYGEYDDDNLQPDYLTWINIYKAPNFELCRTIKCNGDNIENESMVWLGDYTLLNVVDGVVYVWSIISGTMEIISEKQEATEYSVRFGSVR